MTPLGDLARVFADITDAEEMERFFREIFTPKEISDFVLRWELLRELHEGKPQRAIAAGHNISLCKITRGSKVLKNPDSLIKRLMEKYHPS